MHIYQLLAIPLLFYFTSSSFCGRTQQTGCTDPIASNYNIQATQNDGSCLYPSLTIDPIEDWSLPSILNETSGLIIWNDSIWTHNDDTDLHLYSFDKNAPNDYQDHLLQGVSNQDWEDIAQDETYIYLGDFGNNSNGNRADLRILRITKAGLSAGTSVIDTISFSYENQSNFSPLGPNNTDFDCEAVIADSDSLYLFSKQWVSEKTSLFSIPKTPGNHLAKLKSTYDVDGLITGANYCIADSLIVLSGYSSLLSPFIVLLYDFNGQDFFSGNKRKVQLNTPFHQVEGVTTEIVNQQLKAYLSNERFENSIITTPSKLIKYDLHSVLTNELTVENQLIKESDARFWAFPNPTSDYFNIRFKEGIPTKIQLTTQEGRAISCLTDVKTNLITIDMSRYERGVYFVKFVLSEQEKTIRIMKE